MGSEEAPSNRAGRAEGHEPTVARLLLARARAGDGHAEHQLLQQLRGVLAAEAARHPLMPVVSRTGTIDDVVQEVWLRCCAGGVLAGYVDAGPGSLRAFLGVVLDRTLVDMLRRAGRTRRHGGYVTRSLDVAESGEAALQIADGQPTPSSRLRARELLDLCAEVLSGREWEVWRLAEVDGLSSEGIAVRLGCTAAAARGLLFRARQRLVLELGRRYGGGAPPAG